MAGRNKVATDLPSEQLSLLTMNASADHLQHEPTIYDIPCELLEHIMLFLAVEDLHRARYVNTTWSKVSVSKHLYEQETLGVGSRGDNQFPFHECVAAMRSTRLKLLYERAPAIVVRNVRILGARFEPEHPVELEFWNRFGPDLRSITFVRCEMAHSDIRAVLLTMSTNLSKLCFTRCSYRVKEWSSGTFDWRGCFDSVRELELTWNETMFDTLLLFTAQMKNVRRLAIVYDYEIANHHLQAGLLDPISVFIANNSTTLKHLAPPYMVDTNTPDLITVPGLSLTSLELDFHGKLTMPVVEKLCSVLEQHAATLKHLTIGGYNSRYDNFSGAVYKLFGAIASKLTVLQSVRVNIVPRNSFAERRMWDALTAAGFAVSTRGGLHFWRVDTAPPGG